MRRDERVEVAVPGPPPQVITTEAPRPSCTNEPHRSADLERVSDSLISAVGSALNVACDPVFGAPSHPYRVELSRR
jgi:hypothetical protein